MRSGTQEMLLGLRIGEEPEDVNRQIVAHIRRSDDPENILDVITALYLLAATGWPGSAAWFRRYAEGYSDLWLGELSALPLFERALATLWTMRVLGIPWPDGAERLVEAARLELARQGVPFMKRCEGAER